jgi:hypothetical protein
VPLVGRMVVLFLACARYPGRQEGSKRYRLERPRANPLSLRREIIAKWSKTLKRVR